MLRVLLPQGEQAAQQTGQQTGGRQQQRHRRRQHQSVLAVGGKDHQRRKAHTLHDHGIVQEDAVMVEESLRVAGDEFCTSPLHTASPFPVCFFRLLWNSS